MPLCMRSRMESPDLTASISTPAAASPPAAISRATTGSTLSSVSAALVVLVLLPRQQLQSAVWLPIPYPRLVEALSPLWEATLTAEPASTWEEQTRLR